MDSELLDKSDINLHRADNFYIAGNADGSTNIDGIYAIGDILKHDAKVNLIAGCFHDAAIAVNKIKSYIDPLLNSMVSFQATIPYLKKKIKISEMHSFIPIHP